MNAVVGGAWYVDEDDGVGAGVGVGVGAGVQEVTGAVVGAAVGAAVGDAVGDGAEFVCATDIATTELPSEPTPETVTYSPVYGFVPLYVVEYMG